MSFPHNFIKMLQAAMPLQEANALLSALETPAPVSIRLNSVKSAGFSVAADAVAVPWCKNAYYLSTRPLFSADPLFHAGAYYVQEASSMLTGMMVEQLLQQVEGPAGVLDLCAAPGGKSTHIADVLRRNGHGILVANEVIGGRNAILQENLIKWGHANHIVTRADASLFGKAAVPFDIVVADMPCSGEGMFRKDSEAVNEWSENNVNLCAERQMRIAADIWPALKPGGFFIYSTCTFNRHENEDNVRKIASTLGAEVMNMNHVASPWFVQSQEGMYRAMPHLLQGEGFFISVLRKTSVQDNSKYKSPKKSPFIKNQWLRGSEFAITQHKETLYGLNLPESEWLAEKLQALPGVVMAGIPLGRDYHGVFKPDAALALHVGDAKSVWPEIMLNDEEAIKYLRRESLPNAAGLKGIYRAQFKNISLGWLNGVKNQWNNMWPMEWRLRMETSSISLILDNV
jgi:16S rRNA C967 or C1407 C5-methylase (RsmB/RsmF family)